ncbi:hypothetical protein AAMO2058_000019500 [Amorphochlora amoebiformis]
MSASDQAARRPTNEFQYKHLSISRISAALGLRSTTRPPYTFDQMRILLKKRVDRSFRRIIEDGKSDTRKVELRNKTLRDAIAMAAPQARISQKEAYDLLNMFMKTKLRGWPKDRLEKFFKQKSAKQLCEDVMIPFFLEEQRATLQVVKQMLFMKFNPTNRTELGEPIYRNLIQAQTEGWLKSNLSEKVMAKACKLSSVSEANPDTAGDFKVKSMWADHYVLMQAQLLEITFLIHYSTNTTQGFKPHQLAIDLTQKLRFGRRQPNYTFLSQAGRSAVTRIQHLSIFSMLACMHPQQLTDDQIDQHFFSLDKARKLAEIFANAQIPNQADAVGPVWLGAIVLCSLIQEYKIVKLEKNLAMLRSDDRYLQAAESAQRELHAVDDDWKFVKSHFQRVLHLRPLDSLRRALIGLQRLPISGDVDPCRAFYWTTSKDLISAIFRSNLFGVLSRMPQRRRDMVSIFCESYQNRPSHCKEFFETKISLQYKCPMLHEARVDFPNKTTELLQLLTALTGRQIEMQATDFKVMSERKGSTILPQLCSNVLDALQSLTFVSEAPILKLFEHNPSRPDVYLKQNWESRHFTGLRVPAKTRGIKKDAKVRWVKLPYSPLDYLMRRLEILVWTLNVSPPLPSTSPLDTSRPSTPSTTTTADDIRDTKTQDEGLWQEACSIVRFIAVLSTNAPENNQVQRIIQRPSPGCNRSPIATLLRFLHTLAAGSSLLWNKDTGRDPLLPPGVAADTHARAAERRGLAQTTGKAEEQDATEKSVLEVIVSILAILFAATQPSINPHSQATNDSQMDTEDIAREALRDAALDEVARQIHVTLHAAGGVSLLQILRALSSGLEARAGCYPGSRGILKLLCRLIPHEWRYARLPRGHACSLLGEAMPRMLQEVIADVFVVYGTWRYRRRSEMWSVGGLVLEVLQLVLENPSIAQPLRLGRDTGMGRDGAFEGIGRVSMRAHLLHAFQTQGHLRAALVRPIVDGRDTIDRLIAKGRLAEATRVQTLVQRSLMVLKKLLSISRTVTGGAPWRFVQALMESPLIMRGEETPSVVHCILGYLKSGNYRIPLKRYAIEILTLLAKSGATLPIPGVLGKILPAELKALRKSTGGFGETYKHNGTGRFSLMAYIGTQLQALLEACVTTLKDRSRRGERRLVAVLRFIATALEHQPALAERLVTLRADTSMKGKQQRHHATASGILEPVLDILVSAADAAKDAKARRESKSRHISRAEGKSETLSVCLEIICGMWASNIYVLPDESPSPSSSDSKSKPAPRKIHISELILRRLRSTFWNSLKDIVESKPPAAPRFAATSDNKHTQRVRVGLLELETKNFCFAITSRCWAMRILSLELHHMLKSHLARATAELEQQKKKDKKAQDLIPNPVTPAPKKIPGEEARADFVRVAAAAVEMEGLMSRCFDTEGEGRLQAWAAKAGVNLVGLCYRDTEDNSFGTEAVRQVGWASKALPPSTPQSAVNKFLECLRISNCNWSMLDARTCLIAAWRTLVESALYAPRPATNGSPFERYGAAGMLKAATQLLVERVVTGEPADLKACEELSRGIQLLSRALCRLHISSAGEPFDELNWWNLAVVEPGKRTLEGAEAIAAAAGRASRGFRIAENMSVRDMWSVMEFLSECATRIFKDHVSTLLERDRRSRPSVPRYPGESIEGSSIPGPSGRALAIARTLQISILILIQSIRAKAAGDPDWGRDNEKSRIPELKIPPNVSRHMSIEPQNIAKKEISNSRIHAKVIESMLPILGKSLKIPALAEVSMHLLSALVAPSGNLHAISDEEDPGRREVSLRIQSFVESNGVIKKVLELLAASGDPRVSLGIINLLTAIAQGSNRGAQAVLAENLVLFLSHHPILSQANEGYPGVPTGGKRGRNAGDRKEIRHILSGYLDNGERNPWHIVWCQVLALMSVLVRSTAHANITTSPNPLSLFFTGFHRRLLVAMLKLALLSTAPATAVQATKSAARQSSLGFTLLGGDLKAKEATKADWREFIDQVLAGKVDLGGLAAEAREAAQVLSESKISLTLADLEEAENTTLLVYEMERAHAFRLVPDLAVSRACRLGTTLLLSHLAALLLDPLKTIPKFFNAVSRQERLAVSIKSSKSKSNTMKSPVPSTTKYSHSPPSSFLLRSPMVRRGVSPVDTPTSSNAGKKRPAEATFEGCVERGLMGVLKACVSHIRILSNPTHPAGGASLVLGPHLRSGSTSFIDKATRTTASVSTFFDLPVHLSVITDVSLVVQALFHFLSILGCDIEYEV